MNARTIDDVIWQFAQERLLEQWSPEQISGHATIGPETVYQRVYTDKRAGGLTAHRHANYCAAGLAGATWLAAAGNILGARYGAVFG